MQQLREPGSLVRFRGGDGKTLRDAYKVDAAPLGEGRYSRVFGATHRSTGARRAVKTADRQGPLTRYVDLGMECPGRLAGHEAEILRRLDHPNVIRIYEVYEEKEAVHLVLELCEGGDVLERILVSNGRLPEREIAALFTQMLFAVWHLHSAGVVHRDLKPEHFLFTRRESEREPLPPVEAGMKLIDFGLSHKAGIMFTPEGGTPQFMSPESKTGSGSKDFADRIDMWALGVVLHAMLVGHYPSPHLTDATQTQYFARPAWSGVSPDGLDMLGHLLRQGASARPSASQALKHPWCAAAIASRVSVPEPLLARVPISVQTFGMAPALRRLALHAVAREVADFEINQIRKVLQLLELRCEGPLTRSALLSAAGTEGTVGEAATVIYRSFDALVGSDVGAGPRFIWTELVALMLCNAPVADSTERGPTQPPVSQPSASSTPGIFPLSENACWRAFDLLSQGTGTVTSPLLAEFIPHHRGLGSVDAVNGDAMDALITEVFPSGQMAYSDFLKLLRGDFQQAKVVDSGMIPKFSCLWRCCRCSRGSSQGKGDASQQKANNGDAAQAMPPLVLGKPAQRGGEPETARTAV